MKRVLIYTNQYFGGLGSEDKAYWEPELRQGAYGAAKLFAAALQDEEIVATVICGDNYYAENIQEAERRILEFAKAAQPDIFIAGPAFNAGRYGMACAGLCARVGAELGIPAVTGLYEENPAVPIYKSSTYIMRTGKSAADMKHAVASISGFARKLLDGEAIGLPEEEGYIAKGIRVNIFKEKTGAQRALDMLVKKLAGQPYQTEIPIPVYKTVKPAKALKDLSKARLALVTSGGIVPSGNPDRLPAATAKAYKKYDISELDSLKKGAFETVHAGYDPVYANDNPNRVVPLDIMREFEKGGEIGGLYEFMFVTTGNSTSVADAASMGVGIAEELHRAGVDGAIVTST